MKMNGTVNISYRMTKSELIRAMQTVPETATVRIGCIRGDRPWEPDQYYLDFDWEA